MSRGYYVQFLISVDNKVETQRHLLQLWEPEQRSGSPTGKTIGLDVGLKEFYTDSNGHSEPNPRFYRTGEKRLKFYQRRVYRKKKGSINRKKAINKLGRVHLNISRQRVGVARRRLEHAKRVARCVIQ